MQLFFHWEYVNIWSVKFTSPQQFIGVEYTEITTMEWSNHFQE